MQLYPEIEVEQEDTNFFCQDTKNRKWVWIFMGRVVYLYNPDPGVFYYHQNVACLLRHYIEKTASYLTKKS